MKNTGHETNRPAITSAHSMKHTRPRPQPVAATRTRTPAEAKAEFARKGLSIRAWALKHNLPPTLVYEILRGNERRRCLRGASHRAAVLLGIKDGELAEAV